MEEWRPVKGYIGYYEVSNKGRVRSVDREVPRSDGTVQRRRAKMKALRLNQDGYYTVKLSMGGCDKTVFVHRIVYEAFVGDIPDGYEINHIDFDRTNNDIDNLEILSHTDNVAYTINAGRHCSTAYDFTGKKNPNYGNRLLSKKYAENKELSKEKQGRPGIRNGRCRKISVVFSDGTSKEFEYITQCAEYIISTGIAKTSKDSAVSAIVTAASKGKKYHGATFKYI